MATGALDANGIWQYGEDDSEPTFSGMLNKLASSTSTTVTRLEELSGLTAAQLTTHRDNLGVGLVNVVPTSVAQAGGSASANAQGLVTFTGVTSLSLNGVFTSAYENYSLVIYETQSTQGDLGIRYRVAGVDNSTANYFLAGWSTQSNGGSGGYSGHGVASGYIGASNSAWPLGLSVQIYAPQLALLTRATFSASGYNNAWPSNYNGSVIFNATTQFDGFTLFPAAGGTMTGKVQVLGYNN